MKNKLIFSVALFAAISLAACSNDTKEEQVHTAHNSEESTDHSAHSTMNHSGSGEIPEGLETAENPTYPIGSEAVMTTDHMEGMSGAVATVVGVFETTVYAVSYTPVGGGDPVTNHKWVIHEEIEGAGEEAFEPGTEVVLDADHMEGMEGATATIDTAEKTEVYMVDYTSTTGEKVTNHKWVTKEELSAE
ncbi:uncharacterized protein DUF1541 [Ureibacillus xyleni]|uniref:Uncharacterized protein DUF1541 n=1 Tax=Ureibacillus xyleni TaxID=614648 RepID=A0A285SST6_9BACL|nr:YdhK family protein [Ureibacillus xyleni]SOC11570.1 uncharacterized protein DUF1541 [Ureibacillus xyleni]